MPQTYPLTLIPNPKFLQSLKIPPNKSLRFALLNPYIVEEQNTNSTTTIDKQPASRYTTRIRALQLLFRILYWYPSLVPTALSSRFFSRVAASSARCFPVQSAVFQIGSRQAHSRGAMPCTGIARYISSSRKPEGQQVSQQREGGKTTCSHTHYPGEGTKSYPPYSRVKSLIDAGTDDGACLADPGSPARSNAASFDWSERERNADVYALYTDLLRLRREDPVFCGRASGQPRRRSPRRRGAGAALLSRPRRGSRERSGRRPGRCSSISGAT